TPIGGRVNWWGETLAPPKGTTKEYGLNFSAFHDKLTVRLGRFETASTGLSGGGTAAAAIGNVALNAIRLWSGEGNLNPQPVAMRQADIALLKSALPVANYTDLYDVRVTGTAPNLQATRQSSLPGATDTTDFVAKGEEMDIIYNPTPNWRILANVAHQET